MVCASHAGTCIVGIGYLFNRIINQESWNRANKNLSENKLDFRYTLHGNCRDIIPPGAQGECQ